jgi:hypothetical protein
VAAAGACCARHTIPFTRVACPAHSRSRLPSRRSTTLSS